MNEFRYTRWFKTMQGTVNKCAQFELNSLRKWQPVKAIANEVINATETRMRSNYSCSHIDNDTRSFLSEFVGVPCEGA